MSGLGWRPETEHKRAERRLMARKTNPAVECRFVVQALMAHRRAPSTLVPGDEPSMNPHETHEDAF